MAVELRLGGKPHGTMGFLADLCAIFEIYLLGERNNLTNRFYFNTLR